MIPSVESVHNAIEALGTLWAGKSIGLVGAMGMVKEKVCDVNDEVTSTGKRSVGTILALIFVPSLAMMFTAGVAYNSFTKAEEANAERYQALTKTTESQLSNLTSTVNSSMSDMRSSFNTQIELAMKVIESQMATRDFKLDIAYKSANAGPRYTQTMAIEHEKADQARAETCDARYYETRQSISELQHNCKDTMEKVNAIEAQHTGLGYHTSGNEK